MIGLNYFIIIFLFNLGLKLFIVLKTNNVKLNLIFDREQFKKLYSNLIATKEM